MCVCVVCVSSNDAQMAFPFYFVFVFINRKWFIFLNICVLCGRNYLILTFKCSVCLSAYSAIFTGNITVANSVHAVIPIDMCFISSPFHIPLFQCVIDSKAF